MINSNRYPAAKELKADDKEGGDKLMQFSVVVIHVRKLLFVQIVVNEPRRNHRHQRCNFEHILDDVVIPTGGTCRLFKTYSEKIGLNLNGLEAERLHGIYRYIHWYIAKDFTVLAYAPKFDFSASDRTS